MFNITESDDLKVWFTSDWHLGHQRDFVWEARGYKSADDHTNGIINTVNELVGENDIIFNNGDFCLNTNEHQFENYLNRIVCKNIWCLFGNHNNPHEKSFYRPAKNSLLAPGVDANWVFPVQYKNLSYIGHYYECAVNNQFIVLSHYAFQVWNESHKGSWCLCGHSHGSLPTTQINSTYGKILDVGWDLHKKPLSFKEIKNIMDRKPIQKVDHH